MPFVMPKPGEKWKYVPPSEAPPETPLWMIQHPNDKRLVWNWQGKERVLQEGECSPFESVSELFALVEFLEGHSDFMLIYGKHQFPVGLKNLTELPNGGVNFSFDQLPDEPPANHNHNDVTRLRALWVIQLPWTPIPRPYRWWLRSSKPIIPVSFSRTDPNYARQVIEKLAPDADQRLETLMLFAELIEEANAKPQNWGVTLHGSEVALNVGGGYYCLWLRSNSLTVMWKGKADEEPEGTSEQFSSIQDSWYAKDPIDKALTWIPAVRPLVSDLIQFTNAKSSVLQGMARKAHSPGVLRYIEEELGIPLPDPIYPPPATPAGFTWISFFEELTQRVMTYRDKQLELVAILKELEESGRKIGLLEDRDAQNQVVPLEVHDPFTFFSHFCRAVKLESKLEIFADLKAHWNLTSAVPKDVQGIPEVNNQKAWFFSFAPKRKGSDIDSLWDIAEQACEGLDAITEEAWQNALGVRQVALTKLTMGMFWLNPYEFLALDQNVRVYLAKKGVPVPNNPTLTQYRALITDAQEKTGKTIPEISYAAYRPMADSTVLPLQAIVDPIDPISMPGLTLNTILYGPPGTGKTYETAARAVGIVDGTTLAERAELMRRYKQLEQEGNVAFVTFHQSYSYEDFIEGIRPVMGQDEDTEEEEPDRDDATPRYECAPGMLRRIATRALFALLEPIPASVPAVSSMETYLPSFDSLWRELINQITEDPEREYPLAGSTGTARFRIQPTRQQNLEGQNVTTQQTHWPYQCGRERLRPVYEALREENLVSPQDVKEVLQVGAHYTFIATVLNLLKQIEPELQSSTSVTEASVTIPTLTANDKAAIVRRFLKSGESSGYRINPNPAEWQRFVLVIDEINRGNISKILGELITLLEEDKRVGMLNEQIVTLPYSREKFALPPNLYLLGTMNTADKSIALVDLALRRRFEFEELRPNFSSSVCKDLSDDMRRILTTLNQRISLRKDRDHRIGHAFFVNVDDEAGFNRVFERKIVPLLGEYFYGDWEGLRWVLNETGTGSTGFVRKIPGSGGDRAIRNTWQWYLDSEDEADFNALAVLIKNYPSPSEANSPTPVGDGE